MFNSYENKASLNKKTLICCMPCHRGRNGSPLRYPTVKNSLLDVLQDTSELTKDQWQSYHCDTPTLEKAPFSVDEILKSLNVITRLNVKWLWGTSWVQTIPEKNKLKYFSCKPYVPMLAYRELKLGPVKLNKSRPGDEIRSALTAK